MGDSLANALSSPYIHAYIRTTPPSSPSSLLYEWDTILYYVYYTIYTILYYVYYTILYYTILYYNILYHTMEGYFTITVEALLSTLPLTQEASGGGG